MHLWGVCIFKVVVCSQDSFGENGAYVNSCSATEHLLIQFSRLYSVYISFATIACGRGLGDWNWPKCRIGSLLHISLCNTLTSVLCSWLISSAFYLDSTTNCIYRFKSWHWSSMLSCSCEQLQASLISFAVCSIFTPLWMVYGFLFFWMKQCTID